MTKTEDAKDHNFIKPSLTDFHGYEIMIRKRGVDDFTSYCPELNIMFKGSTSEEVKTKLSDYINIYIDKLNRGWTE